MEEDNEILDWGNEDDEHHEILRRPPFNNDQQDELDAEDTISLGDEDEDNQEYLSYRSEGINGHPSNVSESQSRPPTPTQQMTAGAKQESQKFSGEVSHEKPSTPLKSCSTEDSPRRKRDSRDRASPQRSQLNPGRLTHALPPKPMTTKVPPYLPPSHPSIVEATSMIISSRAGGREVKKINGVSSVTSISSTTDELPHNWEYRESRSGGGKYYYNRETHQCTWEKPVNSSVPSRAESRNRRRRSSSAGRRHRTPPDSNPHQSQTSRPTRSSAHMASDREMDDTTKCSPLDPNSLSYEDRHYRPGGEPPSVSAAVLSEAVNSRVSSQSRYDRMPPASPPPFRRRARSASPHESRATYLHEKEEEYHSSRGNSRSARGQNAYTNDPQRDFEALQPDPGYAEHRWVPSPHPLDFPRNDRDSSRQRGRRQNDDEPMDDEHPDSRHRSSLRRRESSPEPNRDRGLPPRPANLREDANQNPVFLSAPRRGSTPPPHARDRDQYDRDQYYEPIVRDYRVPPEEDSGSAAPSSRKERSLRHDRPSLRPIGPTINIGPENRMRDLDVTSNFTHASRRGNEREYDRNRHDPERDGLPRRPVEYPPSAPIPQQSNRHYHPPDLDRSPEHLGQSSHRKRAPLPPQATTFLTSATSPVYARDAPSHSSAAPVAPRSLRPTDSTGPDGNVPLGPRRRIHANEEPAPRSGATGSVEYRDRGRNTSRQLDRGPNTHNYPISLPLIDTAMGQEEPSGMKETRRDKYPKSRSVSGGRSAEYTRAPAPPSSGTNNIPIGNRKPLTPSLSPLTSHAVASSLPPGTQYNPDARPPPSTLIDPVKARELLPPGKESYERPADLEIADSIRTTNNASIHHNLRPSQLSESSERQPALPPGPSKPRQRKSRFDKLEPSVVTSMERLSSRLSENLDDFSGVVPAHSDTFSLTQEQPDQVLLNRLLSDDKPPGGGMSSREEDPLEVELTFHNAHIRLAREPEEMGYQNKLERPQVQRRGASLLDRLSTGNPRSHDPGAQQSLRDRIIPSKRDREDMMDEGMRGGDVSFDGEDGSESKRAKRKSGRARARGGRRGPG